MTEEDVKVCRLQIEIDRLRHIIVSEGAKWRKFHTDPQKKEYWKLFMEKARL